MLHTWAKQTSQPISATQATVGGSETHQKQQPAAASTSQLVFLLAVSVFPFSYSHFCFLSYNVNRLVCIIWEGIPNLGGELLLSGDWQ